MSLVLVINAGSSSFKYQLISPIDGTRVAKGLVERIGSGTGHISHEMPGVAAISRDAQIADHAAGFLEMLRAFEDSGSPLLELGVTAVGHRVVQGGDEFFAPTLIDDHVAQRILDLAVLAPLHNPGEHQAIVAARQVFPSIAHVAVFDTAFHQTMPPAAYTYAIDQEVARKHHVRRYGFHGTSHRVVSRLAADYLGRPVEELKQIVLHLGNGASACAIDGGRSVDTSMGLTPLAGLVMGTRSGDIDPSVLLHLMTAGGYTAAELDELLNKRSGLLGLSGYQDMREVRDGVEAGDPAATLALDVSAHRLKHYVGAYAAVLGGLDVITFTAGLGENSAILRERALAGLEWFGIRVDPERNWEPGSEARRISTDDSRVQVLVVPTDEEREIAAQTLEVSGALQL
ncbi:acetate/propionate family kinase [Leucobacter salsicius]|uniref:acetate/propionate family kinase n=1 Tax=Leucobacter salsicius TaxID=664638 RepID=UPI0003468060|nr:acetate kinase [Leucobacter salsicius]